MRLEAAFAATDTMNPSIYSILSTASCCQVWMEQHREYTKIRQLEQAVLVDGYHCG